MFNFNAMPQQVDRELLDLLQQAEPATIGHFRFTGFMQPTIRAHFPDRRVAGTAITVRTPPMDSSIIHYALGKVRPGDILVIDRCGDETIATMGGAVAYAAKCAGLAGIIVDGLVTDLGELRAYGVPIWSKGSCAVTTKGLALGGEFCIPISCGGVAVNPGDAILADENGILVIPPADIAAAAKRAIEMQIAEKTTLQRLDAGEKYPDITGATGRINAALEKQGLARKT